MGFNRPEAKRLAKAAMRNTNPNPMLVLPTMMRIV